MAEAAATESSPAAPAQNPQLTESFVETFRRHGGGDIDDSEPDGPDVDRMDAEPSAPGPAIGKPAGKAPVTAPAVDPEAEKAALIENAKRLGFHIDDSMRVTTKERADWREARARQKAWLEGAVQAETRKVQEFAQANIEAVQRAQSILAAAEGGDYEALAKTLGHENWTKFNEHIIARNSDPSYQEVMTLKRERAAEKAQQERAQQEYQTRAQAQAQQQQWETDHTAVVSYLGRSEEPLLREMAEDPLFANAIHQILLANHDGEASITPEQAVDMVVPGGKRPLKAEMRGLYDRLHKVFGGGAAAAPAPTILTPQIPPKAPKKLPSGATAGTATNGKVEPSEPRKLSTEEWLARGAKALRRSQREEDDEN